MQHKFGTTRLEQLDLSQDGTCAMRVSSRRPTVRPHTGIGVSWDAAGTIATDFQLWSLLVPQQVNSRACVRLLLAIAVTAPSRRSSMDEPRLLWIVYLSGLFPVPFCGEEGDKILDEDSPCADHADDI
jgi:hypothetical protein